MRKVTHPIRRILVTVKEPESALQPAVEKAAQLARAFGAELELFHAISDPLYTRVTATGANLRHLATTSMKQRTEQMRSLAERMTPKSAAAQVHVSWDYPPHEAIIRRAARQSADLIVVQAQPHNRLLPWLMRLTEWELVRHCPQPVLVVKNPAAYRKAPVLAALDPPRSRDKPADIDARILGVANQFARALKAPLHAMHAWLPPPALEIAPRARLASRIEEKRKELEAAARKGLERTCRPARIARTRQHLSDEHPLHSIPAIAGDLDAQLIVLGTISRTGVRRLALGNTAEDLLASVNRDVLIVKPPEFKTRVARKMRGLRVITPPMAYPY